MIPNEIKRELARLIEARLNETMEKFNKVYEDLEVLKTNLCNEIDRLNVELAILKEGGEI